MNRNAMPIFLNGTRKELVFSAPEVGGISIRPRTSVGGTEGPAAPRMSNPPGAGTYSETGAGNAGVDTSGVRAALARVRGPAGEPGRTPEIRESEDHPLKIGPLPRGMAPSVEVNRPVAQAEKTQREFGG